MNHVEDNTEILIGAVAIIWLIMFSPVSIVDVTHLCLGPTVCIVVLYQ